VIRSKLTASAKKTNTASRGSGRLMDVLKTCVDMLLIVVSAVAPPTAGQFRRLYATLLTFISGLPLAAPVWGL
jgi:hypothetical protein